MLRVDRFQTSDRKRFQTACEIRRKVFVVEQQVPREEEFDVFEDDSIHFLLYKEGKAIGTARWRFSVNGVKLERFAVLREFRNSGSGTFLLSEVLLDVLKLEKPIYLHAQLSAIPFYERAGFVKFGEQFTECDIEHFQMRWEAEAAK